MANIPDLPSTTINMWSKNRIKLWKKNGIKSCSSSRRGKSDIIFSNFQNSNLRIANFLVTFESFLEVTNTYFVCLYFSLKAYIFYVCAPGWKLRVQSLVNLNKKDNSFFKKSSYFSEIFLTFENNISCHYVLCTHQGSWWVHYHVIMYCALQYKFWWKAKVQLRFNLNLIWSNLTRVSELIWNRS